LTHFISNYFVLKKKEKIHWSEENFHRSMLKGGHNNI
jgi:hypothetical protein